MRKHPIAPILEHYGAQTLDDTRTGWVKSKCPFHGDSHASAAVSFESDYFKCFACDMAGDTYEIIMKKEGIGFVEALAYAESIVGSSSRPLSEPYRGGERLPSGARIVGKSRKYVPPRRSRRSVSGA